MAIQIQNSPIINIPTLYKYGLTISYYGDNTKLLYVGGGICRDSNNVMDIEVGTPNIEGTNPVAAPIVLDCNKNGINALDTGTLAATTMYAIYVIADSRYYLPTGAIVTLASNSMPKMPTGYDSYRLIGYWSTYSAGYWMQGAYVGVGNDMTFRYLQGETAALSSGNATTNNTFVGLTALVPPVNNTLVTFLTQFIGSAANHFFRIGAPILSGYGSGGWLFGYSPVASQSFCYQGNTISQMVSGVPTIGYSVSNSADALSLYVNAFSVSV